MKILALSGSYRKKGNSDRLLGLIEAQLREIAVRYNEPIEIETLYLAHLNISPCRGCRVCFDKGEEKCPLKDDLPAVKAKMSAADAVIVASPVYVNDVSGTIKNWLDRLAYICHRPEFAGKVAYLLVTVGLGPTKHALQTMSMALSSWGFHITGQSGFKTGALMKQDEMESRYQKKTGRIAQKLFWAVYNHQFAQPSFISLMTFKIQQRYWQRNPENSIDYDYWQKQGWIEPGRTYYIDHETNWMKTNLTRFSGSILAQFVT